MRRINRRAHSQTKCSSVIVTDKRKSLWTASSTHKVCLIQGEKSDIQLQKHLKADVFSSCTIFPGCLVTHKCQIHCSVMACVHKHGFQPALHSCRIVVTVKLIINVSLGLCGSL